MSNDDFGHFGRQSLREDFPEMRDMREQMRDAFFRDPEWGARDTTHTRPDYFTMVTIHLTKIF